MNTPRKGITRQEALQRVLQGIADDGQGYVELRALLEEQFQSILRHQNTHLATLAEQIVAAVELLDGRRRQRVSLATALLGAKPDMQQLFALLPAERGAAAARDWAALEQMVLECKRLSGRNSEFLTEQYSTMQRVLHGEDHTYAPG
ncbi:flagellar export chaperone FlgN [Janthinobacterium sp.]|uniref:flagellar export chaperone FlgN n=1 Tax=Janthinobacterium sp. TaxID=1871054 RepID=UPI00260D418A|nr:flagellar export chaperone FlgN [Janthinobacterium sp.]